MTDSVSKLFKFNEIKELQYANIKGILSTFFVLKLFKSKDLIDLQP